MGPIDQILQFVIYLFIFSFHLYVYIDYGKWSCHGHSYENILRKYLHMKTFSNVIMANSRFILIKI